MSEESKCVLFRNYSHPNPSCPHATCNKGAAALYARTQIVSRVQESPITNAMMRHSDQCLKRPLSHHQQVSGASLYFSAAATSWSKSALASLASAMYGAFSAVGRTLQPPSSRGMTPSAQ